MGSKQGLEDRQGGSASDLTNCRENACIERCIHEVKCMYISTVPTSRRSVPEGTSSAGSMRYRSAVVHLGSNGPKPKLAISADGRARVSTRGRSARGDPCLPMHSPRAGGGSGR